MAQQVADNTKQSVVAGTITAAQVHVEMSKAIITCLSTGAISRWGVEGCGPYLDMGRNEVVRRFLNRPRMNATEVSPNDEVLSQDFLYFWDSDVVATSEDITMIVEYAQKYHAENDVWPVVGGCYQGCDTSGIHPIVYRLEEHPDDEHYPLQLRALTNDDIEESVEPFEVDVIGTGSMLIHRSILEEMATKFHEPQPWFYEGAMGGDGPLAGKWFGEDIYFCFRAQGLGHPIIAHRGVRLTHYKMVGLQFNPVPTQE